MTGSGRPRVLLVEDEPELAEMLRGLLVDEGYDVDVARDGQRGLHLGLVRTHELYLLDRGLPAIEGLGLLARLRQQGRTAPALVLSALGNPRDKVEGLDAGAEDYLGKPFDVEELLARMRALLRRSAGPPPADRLPVPGGHLVPAMHAIVRDDGSEVALSGRESALLAELAGHPRRVFSRAELLSSVFEAADDEGVVDTYVHYLRRKAGRDLVVTVRGLGYRVGRA